MKVIVKTIVQNIFVLCSYRMSSDEEFEPTPMEISKEVEVREKVFCIVVM